MERNDYTLEDIQELAGAAFVVLCCVAFTAMMAGIVWSVWETML